MEDNASKRIRTGSLVKGSREVGCNTSSWRVLGSWREGKLIFGAR